MRAEAERCTFAEECLRNEQKIGYVLRSSEAYRQATRKEVIRYFSPLSTLYYSFDKGGYLLWMIGLS